jgi:hypothetical protein
MSLKPEDVDVDAQVTEMEDAQARAQRDAADVSDPADLDLLDELLMRGELLDAAGEEEIASSRFNVAELDPETVHKSVEAVVNAQRSVAPS